MNFNQLIKIGVPPHCVGIVQEGLKSLASQDKLERNQIKKRIAEILAMPDRALDDPHLGQFAQALVEERDFVLPDPIDYPSWGQDIDPGAHQQMRNACKIPVVQAAALMADAHIGYSIPIGGVVALENAVMPSAVGVDIACFSGETLVPLLDGNVYPLRELVERGGTHYVWSCRPDGRIFAVEAVAHKTKDEADFLEVVLDNDEIIKCTPDHEFMLRDGTYRQAQYLVENDSLMPFYSVLDKEGYTLIQQNYSGRWQRAHWIVARSGLLGKVPKFDDQRTIIHHRDFQQSNNLPVNLEFMGNKDHSSLHRSLVERNLHWQSPEFEIARKKALGEKSLSKEGYEYFAQRGSANLKKYWSERYEDAKANCAGNGQRGRTYLIARNQSEAGRMLSKVVANRIWMCDICGKEVRSHIGLYNHKRSAHGMYPEHTTKKKNHTVKVVRRIDGKSPAYCLSAPRFENFALAAGVFVHNCRMKLSVLDMPHESLEKRFNLYKEALEGGTSFGVGSEWDKKKSHSVMDEDWSITKITREKKDKAWRQLGTSGSGNHFVEFGTLTLSQPALGLPAGVFVALLSHSGSRGTGASVCDTYARIAAMQLHRRYADMRGLAWLSMDSEAGQEYWAAMNLMGQYAAANHDVIHKSVTKLLGTRIVTGVENHHNFCFKETHFSKELYVHRKGATPAGEGVLGIIPGSMGTPGFVVRGKGNPESLMSASHGAGRCMSRRAANEKYTWNAVKKDLAAKGITVLSAGADEVPYAYKDIHQVMAAQQDLVDVIGQFDPKIVRMSDDGKSED